MRKTFNIGEYCLHGTIVAIATEKEFKLQVCKFRQPKEVMLEKIFDRDDPISKWACTMFLEDVTTPYYADKVINYFEEKLKAKKV